MTAHQAASPVTMEVSGLRRVGFFAAGAPRGTRQASTVLPSQPQPEGAGGSLAQPSAICLLVPRPESVKAGRDFTRATLLDWDMPVLADMAELVASELVTNALQHGVPPGRRLASEPCVRLRLLAQAPFVMCMVTDPGSDIPVLRESGPTSESGRGLNVVESCSVRWGWHLLDEGGKVVWALLRPPT